MLGIILIIIAFAATVIGLVHSHSVKTEDQFFLGLSVTGTALIVLAMLALGFGILKELETASSAKSLADKAEVRDQMLNELYASVLGAKDQAIDQKTKDNLDLVLEHISATASYARESNFAMSDFSRSNFAFGNFSQANFKQALFKGANLSGADLSEAQIDEHTKLPQ